MPQQPSGSITQMPEWKIISSILRHPVAILVFCGVLTGLVALVTTSQPRIYPVRAELLIRFGFEYSPPTTNSSGDRMQINFHADQAVGTEMQILSGVTLLEMTLTEVPYPVGKVSTADGIVPPTAIDLLKMISIKQIAGTYVLGLEMLHENSEWAQEFLTTLISNYLAERTQLFDESGQNAALLLQRKEIELRLLEINSDIDRLALAASRALGIWAKFHPDLSPAMNGGNISEIEELKASFNAMQLRLATGPNLARISTIVAAIANAPSLATVPGRATASSQEPVSTRELAMLRGALQDIDGFVSKVPDIAAERSRILEQLTDIEKSILRQELRLSTNHGVITITSAHISSRPAGLSPKIKTVLAGIASLIAGMLGAIVLEGVRQNKRTHESSGTEPMPDVEAFAKPGKQSPWPLDQRHPIPTTADRWQKKSSTAAGRND